ncbi:MAG: hypothetical protein U9N57_01060 [Pseudomonadota bacterium]|nr:hypothetical protein [Pseudomonadota bacterium]
MSEGKIAPLRKNENSERLSSIKEEMKFIEYELGQILKSAEAMTRYDKAGQKHELSRILERASNIMARTYRSIQISEGRCVPKA